jgi:hypothetical protein
MAPTISSVVGPTVACSSSHHRLVADDRAAQVALRHAQDVVEELDQQRLVEAEVLADGGHGFGAWHRRRR